MKTTGAARRHRWVAAFTTTLMVATATAALADGLTQVDGDTATNGNQGTVTISGDACDDAAVYDGTVKLQFNGTTHYNANSEVDLSGSAAIGSGIVVTGSSTNVDGWATGSSKDLPFTVTVPTTTLDDTYSVSLRASGSGYQKSGQSEVPLSGPFELGPITLDIVVDCGRGDSGTSDTSAPTWECTPASADGNWHALNQEHDCTASDATGVAGGMSTFTLSTSVASGSETNNASTNSVQLCDTVTPTPNCTTAGPISGWMIDRKAPTISDDGPTTSANSAGWYKTDVVNQFSASDGGSGLAGGLSSPYAFSKTTSGEGTAVTVASGSVFDAVGNENTGVDSAAFKIDKTQPTVTLNATAHGSAGTATTASTINLTATASDALSGVAGVSVGSTALSASSGGYSGSVALSCGANLFTARATDVAGNTADSSSITVYRNCWTIEILRPLDPSSSTAMVLNTVKNGRVVPFKVKLSYEGSEVTSGITPRFAYGTTTCDSSVTDAVEEIADAGQSSANTSAFRWSDDGFWIYNVDTSALRMNTNSCYRLDVLVDGYRATASTYAILKPTR